MRQGVLAREGERMTQGVGLFPCCWLFRSPLPMPVLLALLPRGTPSIARLAEPMGCCQPPRHNSHTCVPK